MLVAQVSPCWDVLCGVVMVPKPLPGTTAGVGKYRQKYLSCLSPGASVQEECPQLLWAIS